MGKKLSLEKPIIENMHRSIIVVRLETMRRGNTGEKKVLHTISGNHVGAQTVGGGSKGNRTTERTNANEGISKTGARSGGREKRIWRKNGRLTKDHPPKEIG